MIGVTGGGEAAAGSREYPIVGIIYFHVTLHYVPGCGTSAQ